MPEADAEHRHDVDRVHGDVADASSASASTMSAPATPASGQGQRQDGGQQPAEHDDEGDEGQRHGDRLAAHEVLLGLGVDLVVDHVLVADEHVRRAGLLELGCARRRRTGRARRRRPRLERHEDDRGLPVGRPQRRVRRCRRRRRPSRRRAARRSPSAARRDGGLRRRVVDGEAVDDADQRRPGARRRVGRRQRREQLVAALLGPLPTPSRPRHRPCRWSATRTAPAPRRRSTTTTSNQTAMVRRGWRADARPSRCSMRPTVHRSVRRVVGPRAGTAASPASGTDCRAGVLPRGEGPSPGCTRPTS